MLTRKTTSLGTTTLTYGWTWQGGAYRLSSFTSSGITVTFDYDSAGRITRRYTAQGYSDYTYEDGTDWLLRETWHAITSTNTFDLVRYWYANGRPSRVEVAATSSDLQYVYGYNTYYIQYNWHGDVVTYVALDGAGGGSWGAYDPWGNPTSWFPPALAAWNYYRWNGAWGYLRFDALNLYYVHGRWYSPDTGLWLSPDENGEYRYGSGQDAVNWAWFAWGFNCQFYSDITLGLYEYQQPLSVYKCQDFSGAEFYIGRWVGRAASDTLAFLEIYAGGTTFVGGGLALISGGTLAQVSAPAMVGGAALTAHGATVLLRNTLSPVALVRKSDTENASTPTERHHLLPRQFKREFERAGLNIEDYVKELPRDFHKNVHGRGGGENWINSWNQQWKRFFDLNRNPSASEILQQLEKMKREFGIP